MVLGRIYGHSNFGHKFCQKYSYLQCVSRVLSSEYKVRSGSDCLNGLNCVIRRTGLRQKGGSSEVGNQGFFSRYLHCQHCKWPIPLASLLTQGLTLPYYFSPVARDKSSGETGEVTKKKTSTQAMYRVFLSTVTNKSFITDTTVHSLTQFEYFSCSIHQDI